MSLLSLRKEKERAERKAELCRKHLQTIEKRIQQLGTAQHEGRLSSEDHARLSSPGGRPLQSYRNFYLEEGRRHAAEAQRLGKEFLKAARAWTAFGSIFFLLIVGALFLGPELTGNVIFSLNEAGSSEGWTFTQNASVAWNATGPVSGVTITGSYEGEGPARVYLEWESGGKNISKLLFAADNATRFERQCIATCHLDGAERRFRIRAELPPGAAIEIERVEQVLARLSEFEAEPDGANITLRGTYVTGKFTLSNLQGERMALAVYGEGPLTPYLTLDSSLAVLEPGESRNVTYSLDLLNAPLEDMRVGRDGRVRQEIVARFLPNGSFTGEAPRETYLLSLDIERPLLSPAQQAPIRTLILIAGAVLLLLNAWLWLRKAEQK